MNIHEVENLTISEVVRITGIGRTKLYELLQTGQISAVKLGSRTLVKGESLRTFIAELPKFKGGQS